MANVTCHFYSQPLNHFSAPAGSRRRSGSGQDGETFKQRYCVYDGYSGNDDDDDDGPIFFYTGNESPVDQYVNQTGLMWELAPKHSALVVFAEHRYQGESVPDLTIWNNPERLKYDGCFTHLTSSQALADYAALISYLDPSHTRPVIAFGGSYGGMLSAWMRMLYPSSIAGAIAASAPIWGLPLSQETKDGTRIGQSAGISGAAEVIARAVTLPSYPPGGESEETSHCSDNLLATWPLISYYGQTELGRDILMETFRLCTPMGQDDVVSLLDWAQSPFFPLAEGDFPYPSSYIPFSLNMGNVDLPAWPLQKACAELDKDIGVELIRNDERDVDYTIRYGSDNDSGLVLGIDWDNVKVVENGNGLRSATALKLLNATMAAVSVWFNVSKTAKCFDAVPAINEEEKEYLQSLRRANGIEPPSPKTPAQSCQEKLDGETVWTSLVCNENMNQIITAARGMGNDFYWPPTFPRKTTSFKDILAIDPDPLGEICADPDGVFGYPSREETYDSWATWLDDMYGGTRIESRSSILFSNGLLDPWSSAGVYKAGKYPPRGGKGEPVEMQNVTANGGIIALILDLGGHHLDLMFADDDGDPECATMAREIEDMYIGRWIMEWKEGRKSCAQ